MLIARVHRRDNELKTKFAPAALTPQSSEIRYAPGISFSPALSLGSFSEHRPPDDVLSEKLVEPSGFEPLTSSLPAKRSTN
jgi:hypothetical protein